VFVSELNRKEGDPSPPTRKQMVQLAARLNKTELTWRHNGFYWASLKAHSIRGRNDRVSCRKNSLFPIWLRDREFGQVFTLNCSEWGCLASNKSPCACPVSKFKLSPSINDCGTVTSLVYCTIVTVYWVRFPALSRLISSPLGDIFQKAPNFQ
jgi:hypothetical protein